MEITRLYRESFKGGDISRTDEHALVAEWSSSMGERFRKVGLATYRTNEEATEH
jgi:hypothetical protein